MDLARRLREENRCLPRRVPSAHYDNLFFFAELRLHIGRAVVDPLTLKLLQIGDTRLVVPAYAGTDFIIARDGRIAALYLFFDKLP